MNPLMNGDLAQCHIDDMRREADQRRLVTLARQRRSRTPVTSADEKPGRGAVSPLARRRQPQN